MLQTFDSKKEKKKKKKLRILLKMKLLSRLFDIPKIDFFC